jgi:hypothetical protein
MRCGVGEVTFSRLSNVSKIIQNTDDTFTPSAREVQIRIRYPKSDQYGKYVPICINISEKIMEQPGNISIIKLEKATFISYISLPEGSYPTSFAPQ